ncbi:hypothetical protein E0485_12775 [Paenibacillus albiflavus]|uniref:Flagellar protein FliT n=1 Tax=Paenibacillus albiflavus TaxID=2545760 RepID=A0A4R4EB27_9BACL|nr:hypothetical protein [Paenibacillus albiflavus]TCZ76849.1 hypothetical protein E0485_12775 [Paenibacillus albiflavus]
MDNLLQSLELATNDVITNLNTLDYEDFVKFVDQRGVVISQIVELSQSGCKLTAVQKEQLERILASDTPIRDRMQEIKLEAEVGLQKLNNGRLQHSVYEKAYSVESLFYDQRK